VLNTLTRRITAAVVSTVAVAGIGIASEGTANAVTHTLTIPKINLAVGQRTFGPFSIGNNSQAVITLDRTVAGGLNSLTSASVLDVTVQSSPDAGVTWTNEAEATFPGGVYSDRHGQVNTNILTVNGLDGGRNSARVVTVVTGPSSIRIAGTCVVS
jgi:hypothetical protein